MVGGRVARALSSVGPQRNGVGWSWLTVAARSRTARGLLPVQVQSKLVPPELVVVAEKRLHFVGPERDPSTHGVVVAELSDLWPVPAVGGGECGRVCVVGNPPPEVVYAALSGLAGSVLSKSTWAKYHWGAENPGGV